MTNKVTTEDTGRNGPAQVNDTAAGAALKGRNPWRVFWLLALIEFMTVLDASVVNVALPSIKADLGFSPVTLAWVVDGYLLAYAGFLLIGGRAADLLGRRRMFIAGVVLFTVASLACGLSTTPWFLVLSRFAQGLGAALVAPAALALITDIFAEGPQRNKALGIWGGMAGIGGAAGVMLGGLLTSISWEWVFLVNVPVGAFIAIAAARTLPSVRPKQAGGMDLLGAVTGTGGLGLVIFGVVRGSEQGWLSVATVLELVVAVALLAVFVVRQRHAVAPLIPTSLFRQRHLIGGNVVIAFVGTLLFATFFVVTLYMQEVRGLSPLATGLLYVPINVGMLVGANLAPRIAGRFGPFPSLATGLLVQATGLAWWALVLSANGTFVTVFLLPAVLWCFGLGISIVSAFMVCTSGVTEAVAGSASGLATTTYQAGGAVGLAILTAIADHRAQEARGSGVDLPDALVSGYAGTLWAGAGIALVGVVVTVIASRTRQVD